MHWHEIKVWPPYFEAILDGRKTFEARFNDRGYKAGDGLVLREFDPLRSIFTGRELKRRVSYLLEGPEFGVEAGYVILALGESDGYQDEALRVAKFSLDKANEAMRSAQLQIRVLQAQRDSMFRGVWELAKGSDPYAQAAKAILRAEKAEAELERTKSEHERELMEVIEEKERRERQIGNILAEMGSDAEWSNLCDLGDHGVEVAATLVGALAEAINALDWLHAGHPAGCKCRAAVVLDAAEKVGA